MSLEQKTRDEYKPKHVLKRIEDGIGEDFIVTYAFNVFSGAYSVFDSATGYKIRRNLVVEALKEYREYQKARTLLHIEKNMSESKIKELEQLIEEYPQFVYADKNIILSKEDFKELDKIINNKEWHHWAFLEWFFLEVFKYEPGEYSWLFLKFVIGKLYSFSFWEDFLIHDILNSAHVPNALPTEYNLRKVDETNKDDNLKNWQIYNSWQSGLEDMLQDRFHKTYHQFSEAYDKTEQLKYTKNEYRKWIDAPATEYRDKRLKELKDEIIKSKSWLGQNSEPGNDIKLGDTIYRKMKDICNRMDVSRYTIYNYMKKGLNVKYDATQPYISEEDIIDWMKKNKKKV